MKKRRKIVVSIAMSTDGFIARPDGDVAWLDRPGQKGDYGMGEFFKTIDTILWGRKTYDKGIQMGMKSTGRGPRTISFLAIRRSRCCRDLRGRASR
jgi:dihydrofolate reductase